LSLRAGKAGAAIQRNLKMRKIKNFKINLRVRDISRVLKKVINIPEMSAELEETVGRACFHYAKFLNLSVVYETFAKGAAPFVYEKDAPSKWVAQTLFCVTIGDALTAEFEKNRKAYGEHAEQIVSAAAVDALEQGKNFIQRIIAGEAEDESCELTRSVDLPQDLYEAASANLDISKISVSFEGNELKPRYTAFGIFYWLPSKKKSRK